MPYALCGIYTMNLIIRTFEGGRFNGTHSPCKSKLEGEITLRPTKYVCNLPKKKTKMFSWHKIR